MITVSHFNICCETVRWYWKPKLRNGVQNPTYYSRSIIYFNNYELHVRTVTPNHMKKTLWQTGPLPALKSIQQCQLPSEGYLLRLSTFSWCSSDAISSWKLHSGWPCVPAFHQVQWLGCNISWPTTTESCWILYTDPQQKWDFSGNSLSWETCKQVNKKSVDLHPRNTQ